MKYIIVETETAGGQKYEKYCLSEQGRAPELIKTASLKSDALKERQSSYLFIMTLLKPDIQRTEEELIETKKTKMR
jgi:hypothetical protein